MSDQWLKFCLFHDNNRFVYWAEIAIFYISNHKNLKKIMVATEIDVSSPYLNRLTAPRAVYIDGIWNQEDADKWLTIIQAPVEKT